MNRAQKIALLTTVLQSGATQQNRHRLQQAIKTPLHSIILIDDLDFANSEPMTDETPVHFQSRGRTHRMNVGEARQLARRNRIPTLFILPAKKQ